MKNNTTELVFILDCSGSMTGYEADVVGGFNQLIRKQAAYSGTCYVSTVLFANTSRVIHDRVLLDRLPLMQREAYVPCGSTALLDAIGGAIHHIGNVHKYARPEDVPAHTVFIVNTDGMENSSHRYDVATVRRMITRQQKRYGWEFVFLAANIDAVHTAQGLGIRRDRATGFRCDGEGILDNYAVMHKAVSRVRSGRSLDDGSWLPDSEGENGA